MLFLRREEGDRGWGRGMEKKGRQDRPLQGEAASFPTMPPPATLQGQRTVHQIRDDSGTEVAVYLSLLSQGP